MLSDLLLANVAENNRSHNSGPVFKDVEEHNKQGKARRVSVVVDSSQEAETDSAPDASEQVHRRAASQHITQQAQRYAADDTASRAPTGDVASLNLAIAQLFLQVGRHPVVNAVVAELDEEKGKRKGKYSLDHKGFHEWHCRDAFTVLGVGVFLNHFAGVWVPNRCGVAILLWTADCLVRVEQLALFFNFEANVLGVLHQEN